MQNKLVIVEGIPGSGKTSIAAFAKRLLDEKQIPNVLFLEGSLDHPADYESVAYLNEAEFTVLLDKYPTVRQILEQQLIVKGDGYFIGYRKLKLAHERDIPDALFDELVRHDIYDGLPLDTFSRLSLAKWQEFSDQACKSDQVSIFECCFLQNPLTAVIGKHNAGDAYAQRHLSAIATAIQPLHPIVVYLYQKDTRETLERVAQTRPVEWKNFVIDYLTKQGFGKANALTGYEGVIAFYEKRKSVELAFLHQLAFDILIVDNSDYDWARCEREVQGFLEAYFG